MKLVSGQHLSSIPEGYCSWRRTAGEKGERTSVCQYHLDGRRLPILTSALRRPKYEVMYLSVAWGTNAHMKLTVEKMYLGDKSVSVDVV